MRRARAYLDKWGLGLWNPGVGSDVGVQGQVQLDGKNGGEYLRPEFAVPVQLTYSTFCVGGPFGQVRSVGGRRTSRSWGPLPQQIDDPIDGIVSGELAGPCRFGGCGATAWLRPGVGHRRRQSQLWFRVTADESRSHTDPGTFHLGALGSGLCGSCTRGCSAELRCADPAAGRVDWGRIARGFVSAAGSPRPPSLQGRSMIQDGLGIGTA